MTAVRPFVCAAVTGESMEALRQARDAQASADLVEVRLDTARDPDPRGALAGRRTPVIVTCRAAWEGGKFQGSEDERARLLEQALAAGADFVDVEWAADCRARLIARAPDRVIVSSHDFSGVPADLRDRVRDMRGSGAAVVKVAVTASSLCDQLPLFEMAGAGGGSGVRHVLLAMGEAGLATRVLAARLRNAWTYAGEAVAPGQVPVGRLLGEFRFRRLDANAPVMGVVGRPIAHSLSPVIHNAALDAAGLDGVYLPFAATNFADFLAFADALGVLGVSVTAPFKREALAAASGVAPRDRQVGAANTLRRAAAGGWDACNTDIGGFLAPLAERELSGVDVTVLGAGGSARAVVAALQGRGARITISARRRDQAVALAQECGAAAGELPPVPGSWQVLVNTTPCGTWPDTTASPIDGALLRGGRVVYDLVYNPEDTALLRAARDHGCETIGGLEMLVAQAALQFTWWTGRKAPVEVMRKAARVALDASRRRPVSAER
jgi:3-dehydroquinate dehydratase/shikimate dehydrogenase